MKALFRGVLCVHTCFYCLTMSQDSLSSNFKAILLAFTFFSLFSFLLIWYSINISDNAPFLDARATGRLERNQYADVTWNDWMGVTQQNGTDDNTGGVLNDNEPLEPAEKPSEKERPIHPPAPPQPVDKQNVTKSDPGTPPPDSSKNHKAKKLSDKLAHFPWIQQKKNLPVPQIIIGAVVYNQAQFLREWIEFHLVQGVDLIVIFDQGSTDNTRVVLAEYVARSVVDWIRFPVEYRLLEVGSNLKFLTKNAETFYKHHRTRCLALHACRTPAIKSGPDAMEKCLQLSSLELVHPFEKELLDSCQKFAFNLLLNMLRESYPDSWIAFLDVSEYAFVPSAGGTLRDMLLKYQKQVSHADQIMMRAVDYGTAGLAAVQSGELVTETFFRHASLLSPPEQLTNTPTYRDKSWAIMAHFASTQIERNEFDHVELVAATPDVAQPEILFNRYLIIPTLTSLTKILIPPDKEPDKDALQKEWAEREATHKRLTLCACDRIIPLLPTLLKRLHLERSPKVTLKDVDCPEQCKGK